MEHSNSLKIRNKEETNLCSGLYLVPTPIGNLRDITLRALDIFQACDVLVCEDSRVTGRLLKVYDITVPKKIVYNDHASDEVKSYILSLIGEGKIVAMVSDAGTPMISDPGFKLVRECVENDFYVTALPGANAVLPAVQLSGFISNEFLFKGFLSNKNNKLKSEVDLLSNSFVTTIFYESPKRLVKTLQVFDEVLPTRKLAIVREISKLFEQVYRGTASEILSEIGDDIVKGEIAIVVDVCREREMLPEIELDLDAMIVSAHQSGQSLKELSTDIARATGKKKKEIYSYALKILEK